MSILVTSILITATKKKIARNTKKSKNAENVKNSNKVRYPDTNLI